MATTFSEGFDHKLEFYARLKNMESSLFKNGLFNPLIGYKTDRIETVDPGTWQYFADFVVSFGESVAKPGAKVIVNKIWANDKLIWDRAKAYVAPILAPTTGVWVGYFDKPLAVRQYTESTGQITDIPPNPRPGGIVGLAGFTFFDGNETQGEVFRGMHYRGLMVGRFLDFNLTDYGNRIPAITVELIDVVESDDNNVGGDIFYRSMSDGLTSEYRPEVDALYRTRYTAGGLEIDKARLSSKVQSSGLRLLDTEYSDGGPTPSADVLRDTQMTFIPALSLAVGQAGTSPHIKRLHDLSNGKTLATFGEGFTDDNTPYSFADWQTCISYSVLNNGFRDYFVVGAATVAPYSIGALLVRGNALQYAWGADEHLSGAVRCITVGAADNGVTNLYLTTAAGVEEFRAGYVGSSGVGNEVDVARNVIYTPASGVTPMQTFYDVARNQILVLLDNGTMVAMDATSLVLKWTTVAFPLPPAKDARTRTAETLSTMGGGSLVLSRDGSATEVTRIDLVTGAISVLVVPANGAITDTTPTYWDSTSEVIYSNTPHYISIGSYPDAENDPNRYTAADMLRAYTLKAGYADADVETIGIDDMFIDGYVASGEVSLGQIATSLSNLYGFNWTERAGTIVYKNSFVDGNLVIDAVVPGDKLAMLSNGDSGYFVAERRSDQSFPANMSLTYFDPNNSYKRGYNVVPGPAGNSSALREDMSLPITITADYAQELLFGSMYRLWASKLLYSIRLPSDFMTTDAGDTIEFTADNVSYNGLIIQQRINADNSVSMSLTDALAASYPIQVPTQPTVVVSDKVPMPVRVVTLEIPDRNQGQNRTGTVNILFLMTSYVPGAFRGAILDANDGNGWVTVTVAGPAEEAYVGGLTADLETWPRPFETDTYNSIYLKAGSIPASKFVTATEQELDDGANLIAIGEGSEVELIQFANWQDMGDGNYRLYNLRRGRYGTEVFIAPWSSGTALSFLDNAQTVNVAYPQTDTGNMALTYRAYDTNQEPWQVDEQTHVVSYNSRKPYHPTNVVVERRTSDNSIIIEWVPRTRFMNSPPDDFSVTYMLDEETELYEVHIFGPSTDRVLVSEGGTASVFYSSNAQFEDGFNADETEIPFAIYQVSQETVGLGLSAPTVYPVFMEDTKRLSGSVAAGGELVGETAIIVSVALSGTIGAGGALSGNVPAPVLLSGPVAAGGALVGAVAIGQRLAGAVTGEGSLTGAVAGNELFGAIAAGGALSGDLRVSVALAGEASGGGVVEGHAAVTKALAGTIEAGGSAAGNIELPVAPSTTFRYFRLKFTGAYTSFINAREITFYNDNTPVVPPAATATWCKSSSAFHPDNGALNAFDGDTETLWGSASGDTTGWISIDTNGSYTVNRVDYRTYSVAFEHPSGFIVQGSNDGSTWENIWTVTGAPNSSDTLTRYDAPATAVRMSGTVTAGGVITGNVINERAPVEMSGTVVSGGSIVGNIEGEAPPATSALLLSSLDELVTPEKLALSGDMAIGNLTLSGDEN